MSADRLDPPNPIPAWLMPLGGPLGDEDLCIVLSSRELEAVAQLLIFERLMGQLMLTHRDGSPWLEVAVAVEHPAPRSARYAIWRYTGRVYRVGADGAVEDDPLILLERDEDARLREIADDIKREFGFDD